MRRTDLLVHFGGECVQQYGTIQRKTTRGEDNAYTFSRASTASFIGTTGLGWATSGTPRVECVDGSPHVLIEQAATNLIPDSRVETWTWTGTTAEGSSVTLNQTAPDGTLSAVLVNDGSTASRYISDTAFAPGDNDIICSVFVKRSSTGTQPLVTFVATTESVSHGNVLVGWNATGGIASLTAGASATILGSSVGQRVGGGWHRIKFRCATSINSSNAHQLQLYPTGNTPTDTGAVFFYGPQVETALASVLANQDASSFIGGTTAASTRPVEKMILDFHHPPQALTVYAKFHERMAGGVSGGLLTVGSTANTATHFRIAAAAARYRARFTATGGTVNASLTSGATVTVGDTVEVRAVLTPTGSVTVGQSVNGAAEVVANSTAGVAIPAAWNSNKIAVGFWAGAQRAHTAINSVKIARGVRTLDEMRGV